MIKKLDFEIYNIPESHDGIAELFIVLANKINEVIDEINKEK